MAGDINLQPFIDELFSAGAPTPPPPGMPSVRADDWQQSLMQSVDPEAQRKERVRNLLANFGATLSSTPGNFLQGVAAGAGKAAPIYNQERQADAEKRIAAQRLIQEFQEKQADKQYGRTKDQYELGRQVNADNQAKDDRLYNRNRQEKLDELAVRRVDIADRRAVADAKRIGARIAKNGDGPLTEWQQTQTRTALENMVEKFQSSLDDPLDEEEQAANDAAVKAYRDKLYTIQNFNPETGEYMGGSAEEAPAILPTPKDSKAGASSAPPPMEERVVGQVYESPSGPVIWTGKGWKKAQ